jgi:soluble cytochrome b562
MAEEVTNPSEESPIPLEESPVPSEEMSSSDSPVAESTTSEPPKGKVDMLWNALSKDEVYKSKVGSIDEFKAKMANPEKAKMLWRALSQDKIYASKVGDEKTFLSKVSSPKPPAPSTKGGESGAFVRRPITPSTSTPTSASAGLKSESWKETVNPLGAKAAAQPVKPFDKTKAPEIVLGNKELQLMQNQTSDFTTKRVDKSAKGFNKTSFDEYNSTYNQYKDAGKRVENIKEVIGQEYKADPLTRLSELFSDEEAAKGEKQRKEIVESQLKNNPSYSYSYKNYEKAKNSFYKSTSNVSKEIDKQLDLIASQNGGWGKFVKTLGEADVDKVRNAVDDFLVNNDIDPDSPIAYRMRNEMKAKAEFKKIEPEVDTQFEINYKKKYGLTPDQDIQKEYGLKIEQAQGIKQAKLELEKKRAIENEVIKKEIQPELQAIGDNFKLKNTELNSQVENDPEINEYSSSLQKQVFDRYQTLVNEGKITVEQAKAEMQNPKTLADINAKVLEMANKKYGKAFESELNAYQKQINEINSRYNSVYRRQEDARVEQANKKIDAELSKIKGSFNPSKEILQRRKDLYDSAYESVSKKYLTAQEKVGRELSHLRQTQSLLSGLGGGVKSYGQYFDNKFLYDIGESMEANNLIKIPESKEFSDWLDADKLVVGTGNIVGRMIPMIALSTAVGATTQSWGTAAQMAITSITGWLSEGADMAGSIKGEILESKNDPVLAWALRYRR